MNLINLTLSNVLIWTFIFWHYSLRCGYISDDHSVIEGRRDIIPDEEKNPKKENPIIKIFNDGPVMWCINKVLFFCKADKAPFVWHALSLGLHILNTFLLYKFLSMVYVESFALTVCAIWAINPMLNQNVVWVSGRPYLIGTCFVLIAMINFSNPFIFFPFYTLAVFTNISIALVPFILKSILPNEPVINIYLVGMLVCAAPYILWKFKMRFTQALVLDRKHFRFNKRRILALIRLYLYYAYCFFIPVKMGFYHQAGFGFNALWEKFNIWTLVAVFFLFGLYKSELAGVWFILGMLPNMNVYATNSFIQDRYIYFGSIGLALLVTPFLMNHPELIPIIVVFYGAKAYSYSRYMKDDEKLYRENWRNHPKSDYAVNNLSFFLIQQKRFVESRVVIERALAMNFNNKMLWYNLGITWAGTGHLRTEEGKFRFLRALDCWKKALKLEPRWGKPAEDINKLVKYLKENKVITQDINESAPEAPTLEIPEIREDTDGENQTGEGTQADRTKDTGKA